MSGRPRIFTDRKRQLNRLRQAKYYKVHRESRLKRAKEKRQEEKEADKMELLNRLKEATCENERFRLQEHLERYYAVVFER